MSRSGRPPVGPKLAVRLSADLLGKVDAHAALLGVTRTEAIRALIWRGLLDEVERPTR